MNHPRIRMSKLALGLVAALAAAPAFAQSTSAGVGGQVISSAGQPVAGAEVTIVHVESGTVSRATTDASGRYNARGLRVGGPYSITITKPGEGTKTEEGVYLNLNQVNTVNAALTGDVTTLQSVEVVAVAGGSEIFSANKMGTGSNINRETLEALPSANRNIQDYIRLDPRISQVSKADGAISAGGQNTRYNAIRIDGINASDPFGLESNNLPTERQPVSMDAIEEINIDLANYDTTISGGTGAVINAVTKSGTNEFHGTVYGAYRDKDMVRSRLEGDRSDFNGFEDEKTYGMTFGGPIVKDKLFFFANYEKYERSAPGVSLSDGPYGRGEITDAQIKQVQDFMAGQGYDVGSLSAPDNKTEIEEYAVKLDWNINENHRAALRYNKMEQSVMRFPGLATSTASLSSHWYAQPKTYETWMGELFSDWSENFSTEFKVSHKDYSAIRSPMVDLPHIRINGFGPNNSALLLGTEQNTHVNIVESKELSAFGAGTWYVGDHTVKFGFDYSDNDLMNFYGRNLNGVYTFSDLDAFLDGTPSQYQLRAPRADGSRDDIPASFKLKNTGLFVQDTWAVNYNLSLMFGVRIDIPDFSDQRLYNPDIEELYGYDNTRLVDDKLVQPRVGFNYTFDSDRPTQLRGGVGLFGGAAPNVWLAGAYQNTGLNYVEYDLRGDDAPAFDPTVPPSTAGLTPSAARQNVDIIAPGTKLPSVWKANLAFDHELPWYGMVASAEVLFTKVNDALYFERLDVAAPTTSGTTDNRDIYWNDAGLDPANAGRFGMEVGRIRGVNCTTAEVAADLCPGVKANRPSNMGDVMLLRNTDKGSSSQATFSLSKPMAENWGWSLGYTYTRAKEVSPLTSSQNTSNWNNTLIFNANENVAYDSRYAIKDRVTGTVEWKHNFFGDNATRVGLFYEGRSGRPYSYIFYNDVNGDGATTNDLFYVPAGYGDVLFTGGADMEKAFFDWLEKTPELAGYKGQVVPANSHRAKWVNSFDVRISQEVPGFFKGHKAELALDIMNVGNLLNKKWGLIDDYGFYSTRRVANYAGIDPETGKYVYNFTGSTDNPQIQENNNDKGNTAVSRWSMMLSLKYKF
ncbi:carboxypeptidase regulatory-like domain-containing protein [Flavobacterium sp. MXW15]|uniref:Carboxypeptidase regulatory-like domain-containing protein n=1 Tax=Xanthomonas chitinilytica TaxID=2989819 RepID=A0ABT3JRJ6_9XANT|nr:carboxypeptidase regulatory-like domain-containing protein [Xanthomonas sp. H13-6]MCW4453833.1 carboxypeptidase regulatory-like domain-containing protein [Flavobacterium sp. MXW15]MCW4471119.1 carboxypeptidase regulatory-like domain-containing protein [Xanthomonas sp. H13-6]